MTKHVLPMDRSTLAELMSRAMTGVATEGIAPFPIRGAEVRTVALEVNHTGEPLGSLAAFAEQLGFLVTPTDDPTLAVMSDETNGFFVDVLDSRFWLLHTTSPASWAQPAIRALVARHPSVDWCWLTVDRVEQLRLRGEERWFKADFRGSELLPAEGVKGRRLKVQLEGDDPLDLQALLRANYRSSTALTGVALRLRDPDLGQVDVAAHYRGAFSSRGSSFDLHLGFVATTIQAYASDVRATEERFGIAWSGDGSGVTMSGGVIEIQFVRRIEDMDHFLDGLFSCRDPFRLWAVPRRVREDFIEAEVVDLHVGRHLRMDIFPDGMRLYLGSQTCGNTLFRLLANLQHRYDAAAAAPFLQG